MNQVPAFPYEVQVTVDGETYVPDARCPPGVVYVLDRMAAYEDIADQVLTNELADYRPPPPGRGR